MCFPFHCPRGTGPSGGERAFHAHVVAVTVARLAFTWGQNDIAGAALLVKPVYEHGMPKRTKMEHPENRNSRSLPRGTKYAKIITIWNIPLPVRIAAKRFRWCWTYPCASKRMLKIARYVANPLRSATPWRTKSWRNFRPGLFD